jgi:hypothetical protein
LVSGFSALSPQLPSWYVPPALPQPQAKDRKPKTASQRPHACDRAPHSTSTSLTPLTPLTPLPPRPFNTMSSSFQLQRPVESRAHLLPTVRTQKTPRVAIAN